jgi:hypothetical protein
MLSPNVEIKEVDLSIVVQTASSTVACFGGEFTKGESEKYTLITNTEDLINVYGYPTNANFNEWFQCQTYLQYGNSLLVSRAVDSLGTFKDTTNTVYAVNELGKVEITNAPYFIKVGSIVKFGENQENEYKVKAIEAPVEAVAQVDTITVNTVAEDDVFAVTNRDEQVSYTATADDDVNTVATELGNLIENIDTNATNVSVTDNVITVTASIAGVAMSNSIDQGDMTLETVTENVEGESYELVFEDVNGEVVDFSAKDVDGNTISGADVGTDVFAKYGAYNPIVCAPKEGTVSKTALELYPERIFIANADKFEEQSLAIPVTGNDKLKFIAKSSGALYNGTEIAIAREADFASGKQSVFNGINLNSLFESKPLESKKEIAIITRNNDNIETFIVSMIPGTKDYKGKSVYVEDIINKYSTVMYVKDNTSITEMTDSRLYTDAILDASGAVTVPAVNKILYMNNGSDGYVSTGDIFRAYGSVDENTLFGNKEELDIDLVITNERARIAGCAIATDRADCIAFSTPTYEQVIGLSSIKIVENMNDDVLNGEMASGSAANSYNAYFGNYISIYDKFNDKIRWISPAGHVAGLRASADKKTEKWYASAGLKRGSMVNVLKIYFNPSVGQRDFMYKNSVNPIVSMPGLGNALVWGQKTLLKTGSAFSRINVRALFNTIERAISKMAKSFLFEFNDQFSRNNFIASIAPYLESVKAARGVSDFYIVCDESNNTPLVIDNNEFKATIAVKPTRVSEFIELSFVAVATGVEFSEIFV